MDRQVLDSMYKAAGSSPARVFGRALSERPLGSEAYSFLFDHVEELDIRQLVRFFALERAPDVEHAEGPFVRRLAALLPAAQSGEILDLLSVAPKITHEAWVQDLTLPLRGQIPDWVWYRLVDHARGGPVFNALNAGLPKPHTQANPLVLSPMEAERPEPVVVPLLPDAHNDFAAASFALRTQPIPALLCLAELFPTLFPLDELKQAARDRVKIGASWVPDEPMAFPTWLGPLVAQRLHHCADAEAQALYRWLVSVGPGVHDADMYELAFERFKRAPLEQFWHPLLGAELRTGAAWKKRGRELIAACMDIGRGFPPKTIRVALDGAESSAGSTADEHRASILRKVHDETAKLLVERAERALTSGDDASADRYLSAFMSLDPGSFIRTRLHHLRAHERVSAGMVLRIEACEQLAGAGNRAPSEDGFIEVWLVLTGQVS